MEIVDEETFQKVSVEEILQARSEMQPVWNMFLDQKNGLFVMGKSEYDAMPAAAVDALRIISDEFAAQKEKLRKK